MQALALILQNDREIIKDYILTGNERAATAFVRNNQKFVYATALRYLKNYDDADDVAQEVFIKALKSLKSFNFNSSIKTWLYRITVNQCLNFKKKNSIFSFFTKSNDNDFYDIKANVSNPHENLEYKELEMSFNKALDLLPEKQRETFALKYFEDMTYEEISSLLGTSVGGLKANYFQAVKKLSSIINKKDK